MDYAARLADDTDPLRRLLRAARSWRVAPTVFLGRIRPGTDWLPEDTELALALEEYEAGLCPGCQQPLEETSKPEHSDAYRPEEPIRCHYCTAQALVSEMAEKQHERTAGLLFPLTLNPDVVELNLLPVPPLPPELGGVDGVRY